MKAYKVGQDVLLAKKQTKVIGFTRFFWFLTAITASFLISNAYLLIGSLLK